MPKPLSSHAESCFGSMVHVTTHSCLDCISVLLADANPDTAHSYAGVLALFSQEKGTQDGSNKPQAK